MKIGKMRLQMEKAEKKLHRLKSNQLLRDLCSETSFSLAHFVQPIFDNEGVNDNEEIIGLKIISLCLLKTVLNKLMMI